MAKKKIKYQKILDISNEWYYEGWNRAAVVLLSDHNDPKTSQDHGMIKGIEVGISIALFQAMQNVEGFKKCVENALRMYNKTE